MGTLMSETSNQSICVGCKFAIWQHNDATARGFDNYTGVCTWMMAHRDSLPGANVDLPNIDQRRDVYSGVQSCPVREDADPGKGA